MFLTLGTIIKRGPRKPLCFTGGDEDVEDSGTHVVCGKLSALEEGAPGEAGERCSGCCGIGNRVLRHLLDATVAMFCDPASKHFFFFKFIYLFIYLFLAVLGLRFCARAFSSCSKRGPLFIAVRGPLTIAASPAAEHKLQTRRLSNCDSRAQLLRGMWDPPRPGLEPASPALAGGLPTTAPPGKPRTTSS